MSLFATPMKIRIALEKIQRDYQESHLKARKMHLVSWTILHKDKKLAGLGIRRLDVLKLALLGEWLYKYAHENNNLWRKII